MREYLGLTPDSTFFFYFFIFLSSFSLYQAYTFKDTEEVTPGFPGGTSHVSGSARFFSSGLVTLLAVSLTNTPGCAEEPR